MLRAKFHPYLLSAYYGLARAQGGFPELDGIASGGQAIVVADSYQAVSVLPGYRFGSADLSAGRSRQVSREISLLSDSTVSITYSEFRSAAPTGILGISTANADPTYEGRTFHISRDGMKVYVSDTSAVEQSLQQSVLGDFEDALGWAKATALWGRSPTDMTIVYGASGSVTPGLLLGSAIAVRAIMLTHVSSNQANGSVTYKVTLVIAEDCRGKPLTMSGTLVLTPAVRFELEAMGQGVAIPTETCAVSPELLGCTRAGGADASCRFAVPGIVSSITINRSITKVP